MNNGRKFWLSLSLVNLGIVALLGFLLRSKILFPLPWIDYHNLLNAHSHFAFGAWAGLALCVLLTYDLLPATSNRKIYTWLFSFIQFSCTGMLISFPLQGYAGISIAFSTVYIFTCYVFCYVFMSDLFRTEVKAPVKWLATGALGSLVLSSVGPFGLASIMISHSGNSILYREFLYTFLHLQYNGFFTLAVCALLVHAVLQRTDEQYPAILSFAKWMTVAVIPSLFLFFLWDPNTVFYILAVTGCISILLSLFFFFKILKLFKLLNWSKGLPSWFLLLSLLSFVLKMLMTTGTILPSLGHAIYSDRPVIIGFLHLVFLGFLSLYLLGRLAEEGFFTRGNKLYGWGLWTFAAGSIATEALLLLQGLGILLDTNSPAFNWLLWMAAVLLLLGAWATLFTHIRATKK